VDLIASGFIKKRGIAGDGQGEADVRKEASCPAGVEEMVARWLKVR